MILYGRSQVKVPLGHTILNVRRTYILVTKLLRPCEPLEGSLSKRLRVAAPGSSQAPFDVEEGCSQPPQGWLLAQRLGSSAAGEA